MVATVHGTKLEFDQARDHFIWGELMCKCGCRSAFITDKALDKLEAVRVKVNKPLIINSAARCPTHNKSVGGKLLSKHVSTDFNPSSAFDVSLKTINKTDLIDAAESIGFKGLGISYNSFVHMDDRQVIARW